MGRSLSVILPVLNEADNLKKLIPELTSLSKEKDFLLEIIVSDDNSTDGTSDVLSSWTESEVQIVHHVRKSKPSLPDAIDEGVRLAKFPLVAWLDADGSMPISTLGQMYDLCESGKSIVIGSRFVEGGGFKGLNSVGSTSILEFFRNLRNSQDSVTAVILSRCLNIALRALLPCGVRDLTSGFIILEKNSLETTRVTGNYGDYFPSLCYKLYREGYTFSEYPYVCLPRFSGTSKTGTNIFKLIKTGIPYISNSVKARLGIE